MPKKSETTIVSSPPRKRDRVSPSKSIQKASKKESKVEDDVSMMFPRGSRKNQVQVSPRPGSKLVRISTTGQKKHKGDDRRAKGKLQINSFGSKSNDDQLTPSSFFNELDREFKFTFDPCPLYGKDGDFNGLEVEWSSCNWVNPPYSEIQKWVVKTIEELKKGKKTVMLITARTASNYWFNLIFPFVSEIRWLKQGLIFGNHTMPIPFPLVLLIFDPKKKGNYQVVQKQSYTYMTMPEN